MAVLWIAPPEPEKPPLRYAVYTCVSRCGRPSEPAMLYCTKCQQAREDQEG